MDFHTLRMQGLSIRKIAALRGVSRNAVRRALRSSQPPNGKRHRLKAVKLEPYLDTISTWLADPVKSLWTGERIFDELQLLGYDGGRTVLKDYLSPLRRRPQPAEQRFFGRPGQQMQVDWGELGVVDCGPHRSKVYVFVAVMAWSRALFVRFTTDMQMLTWLDCHRRAFAFFGGVPNEVLLDNLKTAVASRAGKTVVWNKTYNEFAVAHQFVPRACWPARPKTKGRVERMVRYVRERFFVGRDISDLERLNGEAQLWLIERANRRIHRTTGEMPQSRLAYEQTLLKAVPEYDLMLEEPRVADAYGLVRYRGVRYSVPATYARMPVILQLRTDGLTILTNGTVVARHRYAPMGVQLMQDRAHLPERIAPRHDRFAELARHVAREFGDLGQQYADLVEKRAPHAPLAVLREVLDRHDDFGRDIVAPILQSLVTAGVAKRNLLSQLCYRRRRVPRLPRRASNIPVVDVEQRSLAFYDEVAI
ncbi:MAG: IS21 family transposase [Candidatus Cybelea sp.]